MRHALLILFAFSTAFSTGNAQKLEVTPSRVMVDESATILASGLDPNERVTISAELTDGSDAHWTSQADFIADPQGNVDTSKQAPVAGSYKEISAMGMVWSMKPPGRNGGRYLAPRNLAEQTIQFQLARKNKKIAAAKLEQSSMLPGERRIVVHEGQLRGALFLPPGNERHPGVLVLGGSEGGLMGRRAAWLASHGYAALALAYFRYEDLPQMLEGIPLEYFGQALSWMAKRPEIIPERMAIMGVSRGGELTLQLGSTFQGIKALVAYVPADTRHGACCGNTRVPYAWTLNGQPLAYAAGRGGTDPATEMRAAIQVERMKGAIMMISGGSDGIWSSASMTNSVVDRLKRAHFAYEVEHLSYPHAGHTAGRPEIVPAWQGEARNPTSGREVNAGGTVEGNAASSLDAIPKVLDFLQRALQP